jgi:magnesium chelatase family protein
MVFTYTTETAGAGTGQSLYNITVPTGGVICDVLMVGGGGGGGKEIGGGGGGGAVLYATNIKQVIDFFNNKGDLQKAELNLDEDFLNKSDPNEYDFLDVKGQENIKRALEIAAAGGHNVILIGPPGAGKTMLSKRLPSILPPLSIDEALETTKIHSVAGKNNRGLVKQRPFRSPHHTISELVLL